MDNLRLILLILGIVVIVVMYFWYTLKDKKHQRQQFIPPSDPDTDIADIKITAKWSGEEDYSSTLSELKNHISEPEQVAGAKDNDSKHSNSVLTKDDQETFDFPEPPTDDQQQTEPSSKNEEKSQGQSNIITLHITALPTKPFSGEALLDAAGLVGLVYGEMNIYHHFGVGDMRSEQALFSLANMYEPGHFKLDQIEKESIKGLTAFLCLPTVVDPLIVFELMLNTTQRLADILDGELRAPSHKLLSDKDIAELRDKITQFPS